MSFLSFLQRRWPARRAADPAETPYERTCPCGVTLRGQRKPHHQIALCSGCGRKHFIAPRSPWPPRASRVSAVMARGPASHLRLGRLALVVAAGGAAAMALTFLAVKPYLRRPESLPAKRTPAAAIHDRIEAGRRELREGNVHLALQAFRAALDERDRAPDALDREELRRLRQLLRQSELLVRLLDRSLEEILQQALHHRNDDEWRAKFSSYHGRTVIFDDVLRRDAAGRPALANYIVQAGEITARVALEDLRLVRQLPLDPPRRWLIGARLANCRREEGGVWVFRFDAESAVLLTDEDAATACCPGPLDAELRAVLRRQEEWLGP